MTVQNIYDILDAVAPFATQEPYDNSGLLVGSPDLEVRGILFALDVTGAVLEEADSLGANLIVTHHPLMFDPIRRITDRTYEGRLLIRMIREGISLRFHGNCCHVPLNMGKNMLSGPSRAAFSLFDSPVFTLSAV